MTDVPEYPARTGAGYSFDPYDTPEEHAECDDAITKLFAFTGRDGTFSTWRERHIGIAGFKAGLKAAALENVPDCPPLWQDECQYFDGVAMLSNVGKIGCYFIAGTLTTLIALVAAYFQLKQMGVM